MSAAALSGIIFLLTLGGIFLGTLLRRILPKHHLSEDAQNVVRLGVGLIATIAALLLGLLIAAAKGSFDTQNTQVKQITADLILLDNILARYGPEARSIREQMRSPIGPFADQLWREKQAGVATPFETNAAAEKVYLEPISKSPEEDDEAGELDKTEEVLCVEPPADEDATLQLYPGEEALDEPASHIAA